MEGALSFHDDVDQQFLPAAARTEHRCAPSLPLPHAVAQTISALLPAFEDLAATGASNHLRLPLPILRQRARPALLLAEI